ncbi:hypothetical protein HanRHA438_Chr10g0478761 [Helianthus annuus]|nr:hypothetical protein HanRHA438_Chr10g0478761 [Helianthus annuus]
MWEILRNLITHGRKMKTTKKITTSMFHFLIEPMILFFYWDDFRNNLDLLFNLLFVCLKTWFVLNG